MATTTKSYIALYRKYRPKSFSDIVGQPHIVEILRAEIINNSVSHAYLFVGPRGTGKTSTARILAKALNCDNLSPNGDPCNVCDKCRAINEGNFLDLVEIDAASNRGIDNIRELQERVAYPPTQGKRKIYIIDEVHMLTKEAFNALLKTLEEPPEHVVFVLATTEPHKVPETIVSRCVRLDFHLADNSTLYTYLGHIAQLEGLDLDDQAKQIIVEQAKGSFRDMLSLLDSVASIDKKVTAKLVRQSLRLPDEEAVKQLVSRTLALDFTNVSKLLEDLEHSGFNMSTMLADVIRFIRKKLLVNSMPPKEWQGLVRLLGYLFKALESSRMVFDQRLLVEASLWDFMIWAQESGQEFSHALKLLGEGKAVSNTSVETEQSLASKADAQEGQQGPQVSQAEAGTPKDAIDSLPSLEEIEERQVEKDASKSSRNLAKTPRQSLKEQKGGPTSDKAEEAEDQNPKNTETSAKSKVDTAQLVTDLAKQLKDKHGNGVVYPMLLKSKIDNVHFKDATAQVIIRAPDYPLFRDKLGENKIKSAISTILAGLLGVDSVDVEFKFDKKLNGVPAPLKTAAAKRVASVKQDVQKQTPITNNKQKSSTDTDVESVLLNAFGDNLEPV